MLSIIFQYYNSTGYYYTQDQGNRGIEYGNNSVKNPYGNSVRVEGGETPKRRKNGWYVLKRALTLEYLINVKI